MLNNLKRIFSLFLLIFFILFYCSVSVYSLPQDTALNRSGRKTVTITAVGDIMLGTLFPSSRFLPPGDDPSMLLLHLTDTLRNSDVTFGNLEGSFLNSGEPFKRCRDTNICYLFRMPERYAAVLSWAGFDLLSLANNHFGDFGWPAAVRTRQLLDSLGIEYAGPEDAQYAVFEKDSVTYGFCAFSPTAGSIGLNDRTETESVVRKLAGECDIIIVSFHGGAEGSDHQRVPGKDEFFYGENRGDVYDFAHRMIDCGADVVLGHGPHVTRAVEVYRNRFIAYSLGNFCTYGRFNISGPNGIAPVIRIITDQEGNFESAVIVPVYQGTDGVVRIDPQKRAIRKIAELTRLDFPDTGPVITEEGNVFKKQ